ncbi:hypothetical protein ABB27_02600 [Stenotrophomonas terrae]|uniref:Uncharacterized protein n=1 Tax=Stenotrophomonas terrae TaxID=405446 RepID=A0A0R0D006_9GAMM|nr:hypothetical protein [Stenotrophomonas terrae]KRG71790.1 hypothetical protein ABB27_02600 [Stenotrophomonas terrae]
MLIRPEKELEMAPEIKRDTLVTSYYGKDIYVEAWQAEGGEAFVHVVEISELPPFKRPVRNNFVSLEEALNAGLRFATRQIDY